MKATPTRIFPESFARQQMQKVARNIVQANERDGNLATVKIDSCWRVSSSRINCHLTTNVSKMDPYDGSVVSVRCAGTWAVYTSPGYFKVKRLTFACA
jgi:hypothetical protein